VAGRGAATWAQPVQSRHGVIHPLAARDHPETYIGTEPAQGWIETEPVGGTHNYAAVPS
jgi:hypothetical protein